MEDREENRPVLQGISFWQDVIIKLAFIIIIIKKKYLNGLSYKMLKFVENHFRKMILEKTVLTLTFFFLLFYIYLAQWAKIKFRNKKQAEALLPFRSNQRRGGVDGVMGQMWECWRHTATYLTYWLCVKSHPLNKAARCVALVIYSQRPRSLSLFLAAVGNIDHRCIH